MITWNLKLLINAKQDLESINTRQRVELSVVDLRNIYSLGTILACERGEGEGGFVRSSVSLFEQTSKLPLHLAGSDITASNLQKSKSFLGY